MKKRLVLTLAAAALLALAPGRAAAKPAAIFVSNYNGGSNGYVTAYGAAGAAATGYTAPAGFSDAEGVAYNPANGVLYVADFDTTQIRTFNAITGAEIQIGFASATEISSPAGLALNAGVLYATSDNTSKVTAYNAANGATVTSGFTSPSGLSYPTGLAVSGTTLFVADLGNDTLKAFNLATGTAAAGFTSITGLDNPQGVALYGNDLFVANISGNTVGEYNATTGAAINQNFVTGLNGPYGLAVLGNRLLVANNYGTTVGAYGIPDLATLNNSPTSTNASFLSGLNQPTFIAVVPEPSTWALLGVGAGALGLALRQRARMA